MTYRVELTYLTGETELLSNVFEHVFHANLYAQKCEDTVAWCLTAKAVEVQEEPTHKWMHGGWGVVPIAFAA